MPKLFLGCGPLPIHSYHYQFMDDSWVFVDKYIDGPNIVNMDISDLEYKDESVSSIYCSHTLEHLPTAEVLPALEEWYRVLVDGGDVRINVPDLEWMCSCILGQESSSYFNTIDKQVDMFYGSQSHIGEYHYTGFTKDLLYKYLEEADFTDIDVHKEYEAHDMGCLLATAKKGKV